MRNSYMRLLRITVCLALLSSLLPVLTAQAAPGDLINVALADNLIVKTNYENPPSETAIKLFDNNQSTKWLGAQPNNLWIQLQFKFGDTQAVKKYSMTTANDAATRDPKNWRVEGSNDGKSWDILDEQTNQFAGAARFSTKEYTIPDNKVKEYAYYRLYILNNNGESTNTQLADWKLYAIELDDAASVAAAVEALDLGDISAMKKGLTLPTQFRKNTTITWSSSNPAILSSAGKLIKRPGLGEPNAEITLTATVKKGAVSQTKTFHATVSALTADDFVYEAGDDFESGFEAGDISPTDSDGPSNTYRILSLTKNISDFCCGIGGMESKKGTGAHNGSGALQYSGNATKADVAYGYNQIFDVEIVVRPSTTLSYWVFPEKETSVLPTYVRTTSKYVALDLQFTDGTYLHDLGAKDQHDVLLHPNAQGKGGFVVEDDWNFITSNIGAVANGKTIEKIIFGFDSSGTVSGFFRGQVDDILISHDSNTGEKNTEDVNAAKAALTLNVTEVSGDVSLPSAGEQGTTVTWFSSNPLVLGHDGKIVSRPHAGQPAAQVELTATIRKGHSAATKQFTVSVLPLTDKEVVELDLAELDLGDISAVANDLALPAAGRYGTTITWESSNEAVIDGIGHVNRPAGQDAEVLLTATIASGNETAGKPFQVLVVAAGSKGDVAADKVELSLGDIHAVTGDLYLPDAGRNGSAITWSSSNAAVIEETGHVKRPASGQADATVILTAKIAKGGESAEKTFTVTVTAMTADEEIVLSATEALDLENIDEITSRLHLPIAIDGMDGVVISWASSDAQVINFMGQIERPCYGDPDATVVLIATLQYGSASVTKPFVATVKALGEDEQPLGDDATLREISINGEKLASFNPDTLTYDVELPKGTTALPAVTAAATDANATVVITDASALPGEAIIEVTSEDESETRTYKIRFTVKRDDISDGAAVLTGPAAVHAGQEFTVTYGLKEASEELLAQDVIITYDADKLEFVAAKTAREGFDIVGQVHSSGKVRLLLVKTGAAAALNGDQLLLSFKMKPANPGTMANVKAAVTAASGEGREAELLGAAYSVQISTGTVTLTGPDRVDAGQEFEVTYGLKEASEDILGQDIIVSYDADKLEYVAADSIREGFAIVGTIESPGQVRFLVIQIGGTAGPNGNLLKLRFKAKTAEHEAVANITAEATAANGAGVESELSGAAYSVQINRWMPGDMNGDGKISIGDLALVAGAYGKESTDPDWDRYKRADLNGDGIVDIEDLVKLARMILGL